MVELLRHQPLSVGEIASQLHLNQPQTSKHLRVLSDAGLIHVQPQANRRICHLRPDALRDLDTWIAHYRELWEGRLDRLGDYLQTLPPDDPTPDSGGTP